MASRFVILHHRISDGEHWDLMLEQGEVLLTWQLLREPIDRSSLPIPARRIGEHRKTYLDYEGPLTGDRGVVRRVDSGSLEVLEHTPSRLQVVLEGRRLNGTFALLRKDDEWMLGDCDTNAAALSDA